MSRSRNPFQAALFPAELYRAGELAATLPYDSGRLDLGHWFGRQAPLLVEIGSGRGDFLLQTASERPAWDLLALEMVRDRSRSLSANAARLGLTNVLALNAVAELALESLLPPRSASELHVHFPDPWPKKRHHKRRLLGAPVVPALVELMAEGALLCVMTDHGGYAQDALAALEAHPDLGNLAGPGRFAPRPEEPITYYQQLALAQGHPVHYIRMQRSTCPDVEVGVRRNSVSDGVRP
jgi:tRNA (guanine-N7-)-methyltransferase